MKRHAQPSKRSAPAAQSAEAVLVVEVVDDDGGVELAFSGVRVPGRIVVPPTTLIPGDEYEIVVAVAEERIGVAVRVVVGCAVVVGAAACVVFAGLDVAGRRLQSTPVVPPALAGRLDEVPLVDVVQLVCVGRRDAAIAVRCDGAEVGGGVIFCRGGRAVFACGDDGSVGEAAFFALVAAPAGTFAVRYGVDMIGENLGGDTTWLLLEAMRRLDEAAGGVVPVLDDGNASSTMVQGATSTRSSSLGVAASMPSFEAAFAALAERPTSRDEEHVAEPVFTPRELRRRSVPPTSPVTWTSAIGPAPTARAAPVAAAWPPLPSRATGRFARFFQELSEVTPARPATSSLPPSDDGRSDRGDVAAALFDSEDGPAVDDDATARLRFSSLQIRLAPSDEPGDRDTEIVRPARNLST